MGLWILTLALTAVPAAAADTTPVWAQRDLRAGIIGTDTSHVPAFTGMFQSHPEWRIKVVAAFKGGSPDLPTSADRVEKFAATIHEKYGVEIVESIEELLNKVDVVLLESVDAGRIGRGGARLKGRKRLFIVKPLAASLGRCRRIVELPSRRDAVLQFLVIAVSPGYPALATIPAWGRSRRSRAVPP